MTDFPIKNKPPHNVSVLERWLTEASKQSGVAAGRLRRWLGFMIVTAMLDRARHPEDGTPLFLVKGGVAMELRVDVGARATKDLDTAFRENIEAVTDHLDPALRAGHGDFTARRTELETVRDTGALRCDIKLAYRGRSVITVQLEVAAAEAGMGDELDRVSAKSLGHVGLTGPDTVPCVAVRWQVAQKLHACTEVPAMGENDRFRDLIDLQLLAGLVDEQRWPDVRIACIAVFEGRAKHTWPPDVTIHGSWEAGYRALAEETAFHVGNVRDAADAVRQLIARIDKAW
ncbi:MAG: nucleotidyl transferase AbiEii/AbiGii toxin family protein [Pseudonocardiales bacterium]|nr:nucleotidyl transferase AbiEii/AbiGii toxin family protein [Pseudonocardiales bacterium]